MDYETKLQLAHKELSDKGVRRSNYNPLFVKLLRKFGLCVPPPYYQSFCQRYALFDFLLLFGDSFNGFWFGMNSANQF
ncbi:DUF6404 family protein [Vibrio metschnikovii]